MKNRRGWTFSIHDCKASRRFVYSSILDDDCPRLGPALGQVVALAPGVAQRVETLNLRHRDPEHGMVSNLKQTKVDLGNFQSYGFLSSLHIY